MVVHEEFTPGPDLVIDLTMQRGDGDWNVSVAHPPVIHAWPTMLGLMCIISDAIAAAPWWGSGAGVALPIPGLFVTSGGDAAWVTKGYAFDGEVCVYRLGAETAPDIVSVANARRTLRPATVVPTDEYQAMQQMADGWELGTEMVMNGGGFDWTHGGEVIATVAPVDGYTVVMTPTADDWIDPAVRLPEVGEWVWVQVISYGIDVMACEFVAVGRGFHRWAPILVGPPPIPDASEVE
jgi:hypothetical protein